MDNETITLSFNEQRRAYVVRWRSSRGDQKRQVPRSVFEEIGLPSDAPSSRAKAVALRWAYSDESRDRRRVARGEYSLAHIYELYYSRNPNNAKSMLTWMRNGQYLKALVEFFGDAPPSGIDFDDALRYRNQRLEGCSPRTVKAELFFLANLLRFGSSLRRLTGMGELNLVDLPKVDRVGQRGIALTVEQIDAILRNRLDHDTRRFHRALAFGVCTMLRLRPLLSFNTEWVAGDWANVPGPMMKGGKAHLVPLNETARRILDTTEGPWPFASFKGERVTYWPWDRSIKRHHEEWGVPYWTAHDYRRTGATLLSELGVDKETIGHLLGHGAADVTADYIRRHRGSVEAAVRRLDEVFRPHWERLE